MLDRTRMLTAGVDFKRPKPLVSQKSMGKITSRIVLLHDGFAEGARIMFIEEELGQKQLEDSK